jgi:hypothetical protein
MDPLLRNPGDFFVYFPAFTLVKENGHRLIMAGAGGPGIDWTPFFTDRECAERFIEEAPLTGYSIQELPTKESVVAFYSPSQKAGVHYVAIDPTARGPQKPRLVPIGDFLVEIGR